MPSGMGTSKEAWGGAVRSDLYTVTTSRSLFANDTRSSVPMRSGVQASKTWTGILESYTPPFSAVIVIPDGLMGGKGTGTFTDAGVITRSSSLESAANQGCLTEAEGATGAMSTPHTVRYKVARDTTTLMSCGDICDGCVENCVEDEARDIGRIT